MGGGGHLKAFTLSEILITLSIIGVVAALTIPALKMNIDKKHYIVAWKSFFSDVSNVSRAMGMDKVSLESEMDIANAFTKYMKVVKKCDANMAVEQGCFDKNVKVVCKDGKTPYVENLGKSGGGAICMVLLNGTVFCNDSEIILVDVNGSKGPNKIGTDVYAALLDRTNYILWPAKGYHSGWGPADGTYVSLTSGDGTCEGPDSDLYGFGCSAWYLMNEK